MQQTITGWLSYFPLPADAIPASTAGVSFLLVLGIALFCYVLVKRILVGLIAKFISHTESRLDDILLERKVFSRAAEIIPAWLIYKLTPYALLGFPSISSVITSIVAIYLVFAVVFLIDSLIDSALDIYHTFSVSRRIPIQNFAQVAKLVTYFVAMIVVISLVLGESPLKLFAGLGAMTAVLMLIFRDPILGFVAGLQLSYNKLVAIGDWVDIPQHNASGDIMEIGLTTVKVRNFDNTITTVPTQSLISESFKNWRGMQESAGRRIKRSIYIDINSIDFSDQAALDRYAKIDYIKEYIEATQAAVASYNQENVLQSDSVANGRRMTNIGTFRAYILAYLKHHPNINQNLTLLVRQLAPTEAGLPLEIYAFSSEKNWAKYETIQADIFDHLFAVAKEFDLRVFQKPSGFDFSQLNPN